MTEHLSLSPWGKAAPLSEQPGDSVQVWAQGPRSVLTHICTQEEVLLLLFSTPVGWTWTLSVPSMEMSYGHIGFGGNTTEKC